MGAEPPSKAASKAIIKEQTVFKQTVFKQGGAERIQRKGYGSREMCKEEPESEEKAEASHPSVSLTADGASK